MTRHHNSLASRLLDLAVGESLLIDCTGTGRANTMQTNVMSVVAKIRKTPGYEFFSVTQQAFYGVSPTTREVIVVNKVTRAMQ